MILNLRLDYQTSYGQELYVVVGGDKERAYPMQYVSDGRWEVSLKLASATEVVYRYEVRYGSEVIRKEWGGKHVLPLDKKAEVVRVLDK